MALNVSPLASFSVFRFALGSIPFARSRRAWSRRSRASLSETSGKIPKLSICSLPRTLNLSRHQRLPAGVTSKYSPPPSANLNGFSRGLQPEITAFVSICVGNSILGEGVTHIVTLNLDRLSMDTTERQ